MAVPLFVFIEIVGLLLSGTALFHATQSEPRSRLEEATVVLQRFIDLNKRQELATREAKALLTGEALEWDSPYWGKLAEAPDQLLLLDERRAVARVQWYGANEQVTDFYFYLTFDGTWKIEAMRHLALTGVVEMVYLQLKGVKNPTAEQLYQLRNFELVLASDAKLRKWFTDNRAGLDAVMRLLKSTKECSTGFHATTKCGPDVEKAIRKLYLGSVSKEANGHVFLTIGGVTDNGAGFLYAAEIPPPPIDSSSFIWVERVAEYWFLYRTT